MNVPHIFQPPVLRLVPGIGKRLEIHLPGFASLRVGKAHLPGGGLHQVPDALQRKTIG